MTIKNPLPTLLFFLAPTFLMAQGKGIAPADLLKPLRDSWPTYNGDYTGRRYSALTQVNQSNVQHLTLAWMTRVTPGAGSGGAYSHQGEEFIYMMAGTLEIWLDELECHTLREGDSFWFESTMGHRWYNPSSEDTVMLWINTPPTF